MFEIRKSGFAGSVAIAPIADKAALMDALNQGFSDTGLAATQPARKGKR